jgi:hypothetical protein
VASRLSPGKRRVFLLISIVLSLLLPAIVLELGLAGYYMLVNRGHVSVATLLAREQNAFIRELKGDRRCSYLDTLFPHPYLAHVHHANEPCGVLANNVGLFGPDYPPERDPGKFTILLTGGSVAVELEGVGRAQGRLEGFLNARYESPNGREFLVLRGGDGGWKQPQQTILFLLHARAVDAVVTLDGRNDYGHLAGSSPLETPSSNFVAVNPRLEESERKLLAIRLYSVIYEYSKRNWLLSHSYAAYGLSKSTRELIRAQGERETANRRKTTMSSLFAFPQSWDEARRFDWNLAEYKQYIRVMDVTAQRLGVKRAFFIQPVPAIQKTLTTDERRVVGNLDFRDGYEKMVSALLSLRQEGIPVTSLLNVFADVKESVYRDEVHCLDAGYRLIAARIADELAATWGLRRKLSPAA